LCKGIEVRFGPGACERLEAVIGSGNSPQPGAPWRASRCWRRWGGARTPVQRGGYLCPSRL